MLKVLIADDEPKIRNGIASVMDCQNLHMEICGFAKNGEEALVQIELLNPDICLLDICMPKLNGLELIEKLNFLKPDVVFVIITGFDEFAYAQKAVKLGVFDFLLKPINHKQLNQMLEKVKTHIEAKQKEKERNFYLEEMVKKNKGMLKEKFLNQLIDGKLSEQEIKDQLCFFEMELTSYIYFFRFCVKGEYLQENNTEWSRQLFNFSIRHHIEEFLGGKQAHLAFDNYDNIVAVICFSGIPQIERIVEKVQLGFKEIIGKCIEINVGEIQKWCDIANLYSQWNEYDEKKLHPLIEMAEAYISRNYCRSDLSVSVIADELGINFSYFSHLFKKEMGCTVIEFITKLRIRKAISLLEKTDDKVYEVADKVGYNTQHYFCLAFKKILGVSPSEYKKNKD